MPTVTFDITNTNQDGNTTMSGNAGNTSDVNNAVNNAVFFGPATAAPVCGYFCFRVTNVPKQAVITNTTITLWLQNANYTNGSSSRIYVAVENNLFTEPVAGTGRIIRGTRGATPFDRLGRIAQAVTLYGNRTGPTHNHPDGLANYGASARDPYAILTKAFCSNQTDAAAVGRSMNASLRHTSENFAQALQPLVNDPNWNPTEQWVMVYVFGDSTVAASTVSGVGNISTLTYNNGMAPSLATTAAQGNVSYYTGTASNTPTLSITYLSPSLDSKIIGGSVSSGRASFSGTHDLIGRWRGLRLEDDLLKVVPGVGGVEDLPASYMATVMNPNSDNWSTDQGVVSQVRLETERPAHHPKGRALRIVDGVERQTFLRWDSETYKAGRGSLRTYSARFYHNSIPESPSTTESFRSVIRCTNGGATATLAWHLLLGPWFHETSKHFQPLVGWQGGSSGYGAEQIIGKSNKAEFWRYEIQVCEDISPKVRVRIYNGQSTVPFAVRTANPPSVVADRFVIGDQDVGTLTYAWLLADFEMWDDYYLGGQFPDTMADVSGTPYIPSTWNFFYTPDGTIVEPLKELGVVSSVNPDGSSPVITSQKFGDGNPTGWISIGDKTFTKHSNVPYGTGIRLLDIYVPDGDAPDGGWPVVLFAHGGFFIAGQKEVVSPQLVNNMIGSGVALVSMRYPLCGTYLQGLSQTYPAYNPAEDGTGVYPSFVINCKEAAHWLKVNGETYGFNTDRIILSGASAGGYIAAAAAASTNLVNDGGGRNMTLAGNVARFNTPNVSDPIVHGVYAWCPPIKMSSLVAYDKTDNPQYGFHRVLLDGPNIGIFKMTSRWFLGRVADAGSFDTSHTGVDDMIRLNAANIPKHWAIARAGWDWLVPYNAAGFIDSSMDQHDIFMSALSDASASLPTGFTFTDHLIYNALHHTVALSDMDFMKFRNWLDEIL